MKKLVAVSGALLLASFTAAYGKSHKVRFGSEIQAGDVELSPGMYTIKHRGNVAIFRNLNNHERYRIPVTVEDMALKNPTTQAVVTNRNGFPQLQTIELGGRPTDLQFSE
jgi:hypothetical protein